MSISKNLRKKLFDPVDISSIIFFRLAFGITMAITMIVSLSYDAGYNLYTVPRHHFHYHFFQFLEPLPGEVSMNMLYYIMLAAAVMIAIGWKYRAAMITFFIIYTYIFLLEPGYFRNHPYLISLISFLMIFIPANRNFSLDAIKDSNLATNIAAYWHINILRFQFGVVYFFAGVIKMHEGWLSGFVLNKLIIDANSKFLFWFTETIASVQMLAWGAMFFDTLIVPFLLWKKTRLYAFIVSLVFQFFNFFLFDLDNFPYLMTAGTLLFFDPSWPRQLLIKFGVLKGQISIASEKIYYGGKKTFAISLLGIYVAIQLFLPLRHYLYPGDFRWTEEGARFAWAMFGRQKSLAETPRFTLYDRESQTIFAIEMFEYLHYANRKSRLMIYDPGMIHEFAWIVADDLVNNQGFNLDMIELKANILVSLNGQEPQWQIDPNFDLLSEKPFTLRHKEWITEFVRDAER